MLGGVGICRAVCIFCILGILLCSKYLLDTDVIVLGVQ